MEIVSCPRVLISGTQSAVGKGFITAGLIYALQNMGLSVSLAVKGPHILRASFYKRIIGRPVSIIDPFILTTDQMLYSIYFSSLGADLMLILGESGVFDSYEPKFQHEIESDFAFASLVKAGILLVHKAEYLSESITAAAFGFENYKKKQINLVAHIANFLEQIPLPDQIDTIKEQFNSLSLAPFLGAVKKVSLKSSVPQRGIVQKENVLSFNRDFLLKVKDAVSSSINTQILYEQSQSQPSLRVNITVKKHSRRAKIAVSDDSCFSLSINDNLMYLQHFGAELIPFSPLADDALPKGVGGLYITGCFLSEYLKDLAKNESLYNSIKEFFNKGGVIFSEGSGTAYLCKEIIIDDEREKGVGILPITVKYQEPQQEEAFFPSYIRARTVEECIVGSEDTELRGLAGKEWQSVSEEPVPKVLKVVTFDQPALLEGYSPGAQTLLSFCFFHFGSNPLAAKKLTEASSVLTA